MMTMKMVEKKPNPTFCTKPTPNTRMNIGRKIDLGMLKAKKSSGFITSAKERFSAIKSPISAPTGTAMMNAVNTSAPVTTRSARTPARARRSPSVAMVSLAEGSSRGLTSPVRDSNSHSANSTATIAKRASLTVSVPVMDISGFGRHRLELRRDDLGRGHHILHAAEFCHGGRQLHGFGSPRSRHAAVSLEFQDRILVFGGGDVGGHLVEFADKFDRRFAVVAHEHQPAVERVQRLLHHLRLLLGEFIGHDPARGQARRNGGGVIEDG